MIVCFNQSNGFWIEEKSFFHSTSLPKIDIKLFVLDLTVNWHREKQ